MNVFRRINNANKALGPGLITGAADDDPSGIATYSQTGALFGMSQLWTALFCAPFMVSIQEMCGRIGLVSGMGLAAVIKKHYSKKILYVCVLLLLVANTINIGADLGAMAASAQLIFGLPFLFWLVLITVGMVGLEVILPYKKYSKILKVLSFSLLAYLITVFFTHLDFGKIAFNFFIPQISFTKEYLFNIVAILGTTISPYLFFWQASEEVEEEISQQRITDDGIGNPHATHLDIKKMRADTYVGMIFSQVVMFAIILTAANTLFVNGINQITSAQDAALALKPFAGDFAYLLFAIGIISIGLLSVPVLATSASYALSEAFGKKVGLSKRLRDAPFFYIVIGIATAVGFILNFVGINPLQALYITAVINGVLAPPLMIMIVKVSNNKKVMGKHTNSKLSNVLGTVITIFMGICAIGVIASLFIQ